MRKITILLLTLMLILTLVPFTAVHAGNVPEPVPPTNDLATLEAATGLTVSGSTTGWNYELKNIGTQEDPDLRQKVLRITEDNMVIGGTAIDDVLIAINPNVSKVTISNLNQGDYSIVFMNNDEIWSGLARAPELTEGTMHIIEMLGTNSLGVVEFYDFAKMVEAGVDDVNGTITGDQSITFTGTGSLKSGYIFSDFGITFDLAKGGRVEANNDSVNNPADSNGVQSADVSKGIVLKANNLITTPANGKVSSSDRAVYIADTNSEGVSHAVVQYSVQGQGMDKSSQTGDNSNIALALILFLLSLGTATVITAFKRHKI